MIKDTQSQDQLIAKPNRKKWIPWFALAVVTLSISLMSWPSISMWYSSAAKAKLSQITIAEVQRGDLSRNISVSGKVVAANAPQLYSSEQGKITLLAKPGEAVTAEQVVARVDSPELQAILEQQKSTLEQLKIDNRRADLTDQEALLNLEQQMNAALSELKVTEREHQRANIAFKTNIVSEVEWLTKQDLQENAKRAYLHAQKRVDLARQRLEFEQKNRTFKVEKQQLVLEELYRRQRALDIQAPVTGIVGNWLVEQKNQVAAHTAIMTIVDLSEYEAEISVPEFYADELGIGLPVSLTVAGQELPAEIIAISPEIKGNQVQVRAQITSASATNLRQNQRVSAEIEFEKKLNTLYLKRGQFIGSNEGKHLYKINEKGQAEKISFRPGINNVEYIEILSGVAQGDRIIVSDYEDFNGADVVQITE